MVPEHSIRFWIESGLRRSGIGVTLGVAAWLTGCSGIPVHREHQVSEIAGTWDEGTKARILDEGIQLGDTREMVYVALGMPLKPPVMTDDQPPRERWEYLVFETTPPFPPSGANGAAAAMESSAQQPGVRAVTMDNVVFPPMGGPDARMLTVDFGPDDKVVAWKLYPDANGGFIAPGFMEIMIPKSPRGQASSSGTSN